MRNSFLKKLIISFLSFGIVLSSTVGCFGKFALVRKVYGFNDSINAGSGLINRFVKTLVFYVFCFLPVYGIAGLIDVVILNLIEFWTGSNPLAQNEFNEEGIYSQIFETPEGKLELTYMEYGEKLKLSFSKGDQVESLYFLKNEPGKVFELKDGKLLEANVESKRVGNEMLLKLTLDGKNERNLIIDTKTYQKIETQVFNQL